MTPGAQTRRPVVLPAMAAVVLVASVAAAHAVLAGQLRVPIIYGDELGYLENARYLARGGQPPALTYYPGLSLLLVPAWLATTHALTVWRAAQGVGVAASVVTAVECVILGSCCGLDRAARWLVAVAVATYPPVLLYSDVALSESLFQAVFLGAVLVVAAASRPAAGRSERGLWGAAGLLAASLVVVHPRGYAVVAAVVLTGAVVLRPWRSNRLAGLSLVTGLLLGFGMARVLLVSTRAVNVVGRTDYAAGAVIGRNLSGHAVGTLLVGVAGRLFYLTLATVGLAPLAIAVGAVAAVAVLKGDARPRQVARAFVGLSAVGVIALSAVLVNGGSRADQLVHGRYVDAVAAPLIVVGLAEVIAGGRRRWLAWAVTGTTTLAGAGVVLAIWGDLGNLSSELNPINVLAIEPLLRRVAHEQLRVLPLVLIGVAAVLVLAVIAGGWPRTAALVLAAVFAASAADTQHNYLVPGSAAKARQTVAVDAIHYATTHLGVPAACVTYDGDFDFNYFADRLLLGTQPIEVIGPGGHPCGPFVITTRPNFEGRFPGSRLVAREDDVGDDLYVVAGPAQARLGSAGWLLPNATPGPLPLAGQEAKITTRAPTAVVRAGSSASLRARVANASSVSPWPAVWGLKQGPFAVRVAVRWFAPGSAPSSPGETGAPLLSTIIELPRSLGPGQSTTLRLPLVARLPSGAPLPAARYQVRVAVYQELQGAFGGALTLRVDVVR